MKAHDTGLAGCRTIDLDVRPDPRGWFMKTFHADAFETLGLRADWRESYVSLSEAGVLRGMHFQTPPAAHAKLAFCVAGEVLDVVVDLRLGSPTYGKHRAFRLSPQAGKAVYMPTGFAHGFVSLSDASLMCYMVTSVYAAEQDAGIAWDSFGFDWPIDDPRLSERDRRHPPLGSFASPFRFDPTDPAR